MSYVLFGFETTLSILMDYFVPKEDQEIILKNMKDELYIKNLLYFNQNDIDDYYKFNDDIEKLTYEHDFLGLIESLFLTDSFKDKLKKYMKVGQFKIDYLSHMGEYFIDDVIINQTKSLLE